MPDAALGAVLPIVSVLLARVQSKVRLPLSPSDGVGGTRTPDTYRTCQSAPENL